MSGSRWGGKLTSRPLPGADEAIDALDAPARELLARSWLARAAAERRAADIFDLIHRSLIALGEHASLVELALRAIDDEHRHAEICRVVAEHYAARPLDPPPLLPFDAPKHEGASEELRHSLWIVGQCALNETVASAFLEASLEAATAPLSHAALREMLSDEIDHARIGWAHLAASTPARRAAIERFLPAMIEANRREWSRAAGADDDRFAAHGWISRAAIGRAIESAEREVITPGLRIATR